MDSCCNPDNFQIFTFKITVIIILIKKNKIKSNHNCNSLHLQCNKPISASLPTVGMGLLLYKKSKSLTFA